MAAIGILGGMGPQASTKLVELLIRKTSNYIDNPIDSDYPEIIHLSVPIPSFRSSKENLEQAKQMLIKRTMLLEEAGSTINGIACNTVNLLLPELQQHTNVPFLSIAKLVAAKIKQEGFNRVGLLATPTTIGSTLFDKAIDNGVKIVRPDLNLSRQIEELIVKELRCTRTKKDRIEFKELVDTFLTANCLDTVILGCTELPLIFGDSSSDPRVIDTLDILADGLLNSYFIV